MQTRKQYDLIVVGGGTAGALSALAAAREGLQVAVVERETCLGGLAVNSGLTEMNAAGFQGKPLYRGIEREIFENLIQNGHADYHFAVPMSSDKSVKIDRLRYNPEMLKLLLERLAVEAGISLFYGVELVAAEEGDSGCRVEVRGQYQSMTLKSSYLIDATGNAALVRTLGERTVGVRDDNRMIATLMFRISNVDMDRLRPFLSEGQLRERIREGQEAGILKGGILAITPVPGTDEASVNVTRVRYNYEDICDCSRGMAEARAQILPVLDFIRSGIPGLERSYLSGISPVMGVRDARRICGRYELTLEDLECMREFEDRVAVGCYPMDVHDQKTGTVIWKVLPGIYQIPLRCLLPEGLHRTMAAGKCLCADDGAFGAVRVMSIMMNVGESAGYAAALAKRNGYRLDQIPVEQLRRYLGKKYGD